MAKPLNQTLHSLKERNNNKNMYSSIFTRKGRSVSTGKTTLRFAKRSAKVHKGILGAWFCCLSLLWLSKSSPTAEIKPPGRSQRNHGAHPFPDTGQDNHHKTPHGAVCFAVIKDQQGQFGVPPISPSWLLPIMQKLLQKLIKMLGPNQGCLDQTGSKCSTAQRHKFQAPCWKPYTWTRSCFVSNSIVSIFVHTPSNKKTTLQLSKRCCKSVYHYLVQTMKIRIMWAEG